jgi:acyl-CoA reductase-like NAD-dependent aldehyde dehydrogenase
VADSVLMTAPAARYTRRHRPSVAALRPNFQSTPRRSLSAELPSAGEGLGSEAPATEAPSAREVAAAAIEACARALEAWAELSQRADLLHNAAATLRRTSGSIAAEVMKPAG